MEALDRALVIVYSLLFF